MIGDQNDIASRINTLLPPSWYPQGATNVGALLQGAGNALANNYSQYAYAKLQERIATATDMWLDIISSDLYGDNLPRSVNETDVNFRARIQANLFIAGPTRQDLINVITLITGIAPTFVDLSSPADCGGWDAGGIGWDEAGHWGDLTNQATLKVDDTSGILLDTIYQAINASRPVDAIIWTQIFQYLPLLDSSGNEILDSSGNPILTVSLLN